jgi:hypothetical protein
MVVTDFQTKKGLNEEFGYNPQPDQPDFPGMLSLLKAYDV